MVALAGQCIGIFKGELGLLFPIAWFFIRGLIPDLDGGYVSQQDAKGNEWSYVWRVGVAPVTFVVRKLQS